MPNITTKTGEGCAIVDCSFSVSDEGDIENLEVLFEGINVFSLLTEEQVTDIECECYDSYCREAAESRFDARIDALADRSFA